MRMTGELENINKIQASLTITMTLDEWRELQKCLSEAWPASQLSQMINDLWNRARAGYSAKIEK